MAEGTTIATRVPEDRAVQIEKYVSESDRFVSVSELVRTAVDHEISNNHTQNDGANTEGDRVAVTEDTFRDLTESVKQAVSGVESLQDEVGALARELRTGYVGDREETMSAIYARLPTDPSEAVTADDLSEEFEHVGADDLRSLMGELFRRMSGVKKSDGQGLYREEDAL